MSLSFWSDLSRDFWLYWMPFFLASTSTLFSKCDLCCHSMNRIQKKATKDTKDKHPSGWWSKQSTYICCLSLFRTTDTIFPWVFWVKLLTYYWLTLVHMKLTTVRAYYILLISIIIVHVHTCGTANSWCSIMKTKITNDTRR